MMWQRDIFNSFHLPYFHNVYCILSVRAKIMSTSFHTHCTAYRSNDHSNQKHIDRSIVRTNKFEIRFKTKKKKTSICIDLFLHTISNYCAWILLLFCSYTHAMNGKGKQKKCKQEVSIKSDRYASETITLLRLLRLFPQPKNTFRSNFVAYFSSFFLLINYDLRWKKNRSMYAHWTLLADHL